MTKSEAKTLLKRLIKEHCTCDCDEVEFCHHVKGCPYRIAAFAQRELRALAGPLYPARA